MVVQVDLAVVGGIITGLVGLVSAIIAISAYYRDRKKFLQAEGASMQRMLDLQGRVDSMCKENTDLKSKLSTHDTDLATIKTKVEGIEKGIDELKNDVKEVSRKLDDFVTRLASS